MRKIWHWVLVIIICAAMGAVAKAYRDTSSNDSEQQNMEFRINSIEQRVYSIESNLRRLEQQINTFERRPAIQSSRNPEIDALRSELETMKNRVREIECGVVHLDERTLSASAKGARRQTGSEPKDSCRLNPETSVRLSLRQ